MRQSDALGEVLVNLQLARISAEHNLDDALTSEELRYHMLDVASVASILVGTSWQCCTPRHQVFPTWLTGMLDSRVEPICVTFAGQT